MNFSCAESLVGDVRHAGPNIESGTSSAPPLGGARTDGLSGLDGFLKTVVGLAGAQGGAIRALTDDGEYLRLVAAVGVSEEFVQGEFLVGVCGICGRAIREDDIRSASDFRECSRVLGMAQAGACYRHAIAVPLEYKGGPVGVFNLFYDRPDETPSEIRVLLKPIGQLLGLTLENNALERQNVRARLVNERQMMATDIHDSLAQTLAFARMRLPLLEDAIRDHDEPRSYRYCHELNQELSRAHRGLRELITHFRAGMGGRGLRRGLRELVERFRETSGIALEYDNQLPDAKLPVDCEVQVFFIIQEALANIRKHARATRARLVVDRVGDDLEFMVEDNGCGLLAEVLADRDPEESGSYGLRIMRERALRFGGRISFENLPKGGTRVRVFIPTPGTAGEGGRA